MCHRPSCVGRLRIFALMLLLLATSVGCSLGQMLVIKGTEIVKSKRPKYVSLCQSMLYKTKFEFDPTAYQEP